jgi:predicted ATPase
LYYIGLWICNFNGETPKSISYQEKLPAIYFNDAFSHQEETFYSLLKQNDDAAVLDYLATSSHSISHHRSLLHCLRLNLLLFGLFIVSFLRYILFLVKISKYQ